MRPDDQGHGEVGFHGNPLKEIPTLDGLSRAKHWNDWRSSEKAPKGSAFEELATRTSSRHCQATHEG